MVTCNRQAPARIELRLMAPINTSVVVTTTQLTTTTTTTTTKTSMTSDRPKLAFTIDALVGAQTQTQTPASVPLYEVCRSPHKSPTSSTIDSDCDVVGDASPTPTESSVSAKQCPLRRPLPLPAMKKTLPQTAATPLLPHMLTPTALNFSPATHLPPPTSHAAIPAHVLSAQFQQMAAALAHQQHQQQQQQQQHRHHHLHAPTAHPMALFPNQAHMLTGAPFVRDTYPLYPWFLTRHGRVFPHRFPGNFLLQPFRKPKRVRTAFSPTQLLKLEHAFEGNHYVVGAERKQLAQVLSLSETQVKVWFQNRRTKHKRMQQEGGDSDTRSNKGSQADGNEGKNDSTQDSFEDYQHEAEDFDEQVGGDDMIDMRDYEGSDMRDQFRQQIHDHQQRMLQEEQEQFSQLNFRQQHQQQ